MKVAVVFHARCAVVHKKIGCDEAKWTGIGKAVSALRDKSGPNGALAPLLLRRWLASQTTPRTSSASSSAEFDRKRGPDSMPASASQDGHRTPKAVCL